MIVLLSSIWTEFSNSVFLFTRKPSCRWQTRVTLAKSLHGLHKSSGVVSCIARLPIDSVPMVSYYVLYSNCVCKMRRFGDNRLLPSHSSARSKRHQEPTPRLDPSGNWHTTVVNSALSSFIFYIFWDPSKSWPMTHMPHYPWSMVITVNRLAFENYCFSQIIQLHTYIQKNL